MNSAQRQAALQQVVDSYKIHPVAGRSYSPRDAANDDSSMSANDDISQHSPQSVTQGRTARPDLNVPVSGNDLQTQLTDLSQQSEGGMISINGQNYEQPASGGNDLTRALGGIFQQLQPAAKSHLLTQKMVQDAVGSAVTDVTKDQLGISRAARDVQALTQQRANGMLSDQAYEAAIAQAKNGQAGYTFDQLVRAPGGAQLLGVQDQIHQEQENTLQAYAKHNGWDRSEVKWDDKQNGPTPDYQAADFNFRRAQRSEIEAKMQHYPDKVKSDERRAALDNLTRALGHSTSLLSSIHKSLETGMHDPQTEARLKLQAVQLQNRIQMWDGQQAKLMGDDGLGNVAAPAQPAPSPAQPATPATVGGGNTVAVSSIDEAIAGVRANKYPPGTTLSLGGVQQRVTGNPAQPFEPVQ